ncbi:class III signal peptide-containing protein [Methanococcus maripaludis]|uniref:Type II secretory pathway pseudopilin PulG n=1 Tax=Methanococcus maripaludis TaxID=39152 RepID=A0A7J9PBT3_METMI|nr:class III signal peptide-containing protein [Methanococcus maripaludis]MBA2860682.1 type II secretory pathway pseudopilin PulG [Methanococcus maripaludis]
MLLNSKRGQLSIEMVILILAVLLGGAVFAAHMTKDTTNAGEVKALKKLTLGAFSNSAIESGASMIPEEEEEAEPEDDESEEEEPPTEGINEIQDIRINPGNGHPVEFLIKYNGVTSLTHSNIHATAGYATFIQVKAIGNTGITINGTTYNNKAFIIESVDPDTPMTYEITRKSNGGLLGLIFKNPQYSITVTAPDGAIKLTYMGPNFNTYYN